MGSMSMEHDSSEYDSDTEHNRLMDERVLDHSDGNAAANPGDEDAEVNGGPMAMLMQRSQSTSAQPRKRHIAREQELEDGEVLDESPQSPNVSARSPPTARSQAKKAKESPQLHPNSVQFHLRRISGLVSAQRHDHLRPPVVPMNSGGMDRSRNNNNPANPSGSQRASFWHTPARQNHGNGPSQPALNNGVGTSSSRARQPNRQQQQPVAVPGANENIGPKTPPTEPPATNRRRALSTGETSSSARGAGSSAKRPRMSANANDSNGEPQTGVVANNGENVLRDAIRHARRVLDAVEREREQFDEEAVDVSENGEIENGPNVFDLPPPASPDPDDPHFFFQDHDYNLFKRRSAEGIEELLDQRQLNVRTFNRYPQRQNNVRPTTPQHDEQNQEGFVCRCVYVTDDRTPRRMQPRNRDIHGRSNDHRSQERGNDDWQTPAGRGRQPYRERRFPSTAPTFNHYSRFDRSESRPAVPHNRPGRSESRPANSRFDRSESRPAVHHNRPDRSASRPPMQQHNRFGRALSNESVFDERNNWPAHGNRGNFVWPQRANYRMPAAPRNLPVRHNDNIVNNDVRTPRYPNPNHALLNRRPNHFAAYPLNGNSGDRVGRPNVQRNAYAPNPSRTFPSPNRRPFNFGAPPNRNNWTGNRDRIRQPDADAAEKNPARFFFGGPVFTQPAERVRPRPPPYNPPVGRGNMNNRFGPRREFAANAGLGHHDRNPRLQQPFVRAQQNENRIGFRREGEQRAGPSGIGFNRGNPRVGGRQQEDWNLDELRGHFG